MVSSNDEEKGQSASSSIICGTRQSSLAWAHDELLGLRLMIGSKGVSFHCTDSSPPPVVLSPQEEAEDREDEDADDKAGDGGAVIYPEEESTSLSVETTLSPELLSA